MVRLSDVKAANADFVASLSEPLVGVFVGGTSGICEYALRSLVSNAASVGKSKSRNIDLRIYIVGRNAKAADVTIADCRKLCPQANFTFVRAKDLALLKDVDRVCEEIIKLETAANGPHSKPRVDVLVMSQAGSIFVTRKDTTEGLDNLMSLMYYSRMRFIDRLLPLLVESRLPPGGGAAHIISIYAPKTEGQLFADDLSLRQPGHFTYMNARSHIAYFKTLFFEKLVAQYPGKLSFCHVFPGLVHTPGFKNPELPTWFKVVFPIVGRPLMWVFGTSHAEAGARTLFLATPRFPAKGAREDSDVAVGADGQKGSGVYTVWSDSETMSREEVYKKTGVDKEELREMVWKHTMGAFEDIEKGNVFTG
ncbi:hypothetical protein PV05_11778 [Exophiala xenobiotica]|uniref:Ketoreductase (KR) domain-containing protein n=1 Tax=Exophiala xenobiotica TaxID=348802 RepID=A0A0D2E3X1_9EURO|nr:uncharacterized protein PV05_11778 [Exophiala xenobiotica]KIW50163.1 hypothetical protein PV05_11778 [Exophiala xenobiotica]